MNTTIRHLFALLLLGNSYGLSQAQTLKAPYIEMAAGQFVSFHVSMENTKANEYNALTLNIHLDEGLHLLENPELTNNWKNQYCITEDGSAYPTDIKKICKLGDITFWALNDSNPNDIRMAIASTCSLPSKNVDDLFSFQFEADKNITPYAFYNIRLHNILFEYAPKGKDNAEDLLIKIFVCKLGDANKDKNVDIQDGTLIINKILEKEDNSQSSYNVWLADMNNDKVIDIFDVMQLIDLIGSIPPASHHTTRSEAIGSFEDMSLKLSDDYAILCIPNSQRFTSFQFEVELTDEVELKNAKLIGVPTNHMVQFTKIADNNYRVIGISLDNSQLASNNGDNIIGLEIPNCEKMVIRNAMFVTPQGKATYFIDKELEKSVTQENDGPVYDLLGRKVQNENKQLRKGVYIKKNKKVVVK